MTLVDLLIWVGILAILVIAGWFIWSQVTLPEPLNKIVLVLIVVVVAVVAVGFLLHLGGGGTSLKVG